MVEEKEIDDIYKITTERQLNKKKVILLILLIIIVIGLIMIVKNSIIVIREYNIYEQYENQLSALKRQEEDNKKQEEKEKEEKNKQEKIPKLTQERKRSYRKHISCRKEKSLFDF